MRQIILDTETTGLDPEQGHRIIEIGCIELFDRRITGKNFHKYINPQREIHPQAFKVHGISNKFLQDKPIFKDVIEEFIEFIKGSEIIIHNAPFDVGFLNYEFKLANWDISFTEYCNIIDTLSMARNKHPGQKNNLDALCKRYNINNTKRTLHGALLDAEILAGVYLAMTGGQTSLLDNLIENELNLFTYQDNTVLNSSSPIIYASNNELTEHRGYLEYIKKNATKLQVNEIEEI